MSYNWNWGIFFQTSPDGVHTYLTTLLLGTAWTLTTALAAWCLALAMGSLVGVMRTTPHPWLVRLGQAYVELFRNIPLLVQMFLWYFVLPEVLPTEAGDWLKQLPDASFYTAVVALGFYTSARVAEQVRAGILSLASGQRLAALALGLTLPQAYLLRAPADGLPHHSAAADIGVSQCHQEQRRRAHDRVDGAYRARTRHAGNVLPGIRGLHCRNHHLHHHQYRRDFRNALGRAPSSGSRTHRPCAASCPPLIRIDVREFRFRRHHSLAAVPVL